MTAVNAAKIVTLEDRMDRQDKRLARIEKMVLALLLAVAGAGLFGPDFVHQLIATYLPVPAAP